MFRLMALAAMAACCFAQSHACTAVEGGEVLGGDLARAVPMFQGIPGNVPLAPAPQPGGTRLFTVSELQAIATRFTVKAAPVTEACFQLLTEPLARASVLEAMQAALPIAGVQIELLEVSSEKVPHGMVEFPREGLGVPALPEQRSPVLWRGNVVYGSNRTRFAVWGRVRVSAPVERIIAAESLKPGTPIQVSQLRREMVESFPSLKPAIEMERMAGMLLLRGVPAGGEVKMDNLTAPIDVHRGDQVRVEVRIGPAHLALNGRAESNGRVGDMIPVRNLDSSRTFRARVEGSGRVVVEQANVRGE